MLENFQGTLLAAERYTVLGQADGIGVGPILLVLAVLLLLVIGYFVLRKNAGVEVKEPRAERKKGEVPTADLLESREEVDAPVEINEEMSLAEIKRAKMARVKAKNGAKGKRETALEATERSIAEREAEKSAPETVEPAPDEEAAHEESNEETDTPTAEAAKEELATEVEAEESVDEESSPEDEPPVAEPEEKGEKVEDSTERAEEGSQEENSAVESDLAIPEESTSLGSEPSITLPKPKMLKPGEKTSEGEKKLPRPGGLSLPKPASLLKKKAEDSKEEKEEKEVASKAEVVEEKVEPAAEEPAPEVKAQDAEKLGLEVAESVEPATQIEEPEAEKEEPAKAAPAKKKEPEEVETSLREGLAKTRTGFIDRLGNLFKGEKLPEDLVEEVEEILFTADIGVTIAKDILGTVEAQLSTEQKQDPSEVWSFIRAYCEDMLTKHQEPLEFDSHSPFVMLVIGINGVGKTTTIGKIASQLQRQGKSVLLVAGDTFRAAAVDQLEIWAKRTGIPMHRGEDQADPSSVIFSGIERGVREKADVIICDTAGRLHTKSNLMDELEKMARVAGKAYEGAPHETLLVLDANTGQNAIRQAELFNEALDITGVALTKLDGTAKGGVILGICDELNVPVRYIGIGEGIRDLRPFDAEEFVEALFM